MVVVVAGRSQARRARSFVELAALRSATYGLLGSLFLDPREVDVVAARRLCGSAVASGLPFLPSLRALVELVDDVSETDLLERAGLFVLGACPPYESAWVDERGRDRGLVSVAVERAYAAAGLGFADANELPDHAAIELGFMQLLCDDEERSRDRGDGEALCEYLRRQAEFLERHLGRWFPPFCQGLGRATAPGSLHGALARAGHAFVVHDRELVRVLVGELP